MPEPFVIGLSGQKASGKGFFVTMIEELFPDKTILHVKSSDVLGEILDILNVSKTRQNLQDLAPALTEPFGDDVISAAVAHRIRSTPSDIAIFDGVRWEADLVMIRTFPRSRVVFIDADERVRYERSRGRGEKVGEAQASFTEFKRQEGASTETSLPWIRERADVVIENNGSLNEFRKNIQLLKPQFFA